MLARIPTQRLRALLKVAGLGQPRLGSGRARRTRLFLGRHRRALSVCLVLLALWLTIRSAVPAPLATVAVVVASHDLPAGHQLTATDLQSRAWPATAAPTGLLRTAVGRVLATPIRAGELLTDARVMGPGLLAGQPSGTVAITVRLGDPMAGALVRAGDRVDVLVSAGTSWDAGPDLADGTETSPSTASPEPSVADSADANPTSGNSSNGNYTGMTQDGGTGMTQGGGAEAERVVADALVLAVPGSRALESGDIGGSGGGGGGLAGLSGGGDLSSGGIDDESGAAGDGSDQVIVLAVSAAESRRLALAQTGKFVTIALLRHA